MWRRQILCSPRCPRTVILLPPATSPTQCRAAWLILGDPSTPPHASLYSTGGKKTQNRACSSWSAWLASFELTCCMAWDVKSLVRRPACSYLTNKRSAFCTFLYYHCMLLWCWYRTPRKTSVNSLNAGLFFPTHAIKEAKPRASSCVLHNAS